jgi:uncharacterized LabA/DUF88 family protein
MNKRIFVLIDFDNIFKKSLNEYSSEEFELIIKDLIRDVISLNPSPSEIKLRFYGGWFKDDILTGRASLLQQLISTISIFPIIKLGARIKGNIELATTLYYYPSHVWTNTFKEKEGIPRLRINQEKLPEWCSLNRDQCPVFLLNKFTIRKEKQCHIEHCEIKNSEAFTGIEQKMVDTMIACDLITFSQEKGVEAVCLFSDDFDLLPPLGFSSIFKSEKNPDLKIQLFIKNEHQINLAKQILSPFDVKITQYE